MDGSNQPKKPRYVPFLSRTKAMSSGGPGGWEATTIGFTLVGCIGLCSFIGWWLDSRFGTSYWLPILFLFGAVAGFREMFVMLGRLNREQAAKKAALAEKRRAAQIAAPIVTEEKKKRIFKVPAPFEEEKNRRRRAGNDRRIDRAAPERRRRRRFEKMSKTLVPPAPSSRFDGAAKEKPNTASRMLPPLDAAFLGRIYRSMAWSGLFAAVLAAATMDLGGVLCIVGGFGLAALLLRTQEILVRAVVRPKNELAGFANFGPMFSCSMVCH